LPVDLHLEDQAAPGWNGDLSRSGHHVVSVKGRLEVSFIDLGKRGYRSSDEDHSVLTHSLLLAERKSQATLYAAKIAEECGRVAVSNAINVMGSAIDPERKTVSAGNPA
jgi:hypothetical protein